MEVTATIEKAADDISLITTYEARLALNLGSSVTETLDDQIEMFTRWSSDEIAKICNRVFARETLTEIYRDVGFVSNRIWLSHYPVTEITAVSEDDGTDLTVDIDYEIDKETGKLYRINGYWTGPVSISYTGGYILPNRAPESLKQATLLMVREAYYAAVRGDQSIKMVAHKESRVIYFDPNALALKAVSSSGSPARRSISDLLEKYTRFWI